MNELKIYTSFFRKNRFVYFFSIVIGILAGFFISAIISEKYTSDGFYELSYNDQNIEKKKLETDELVGVLRDAQFSEMFNFSDVQTIEIYKPGPVSLNVKVISATQEQASENLKQIEDYIFSHTTIKRLSLSNYAEKVASVWVFMSVGALIGFLFASVVGLMKVYLRRY